MPFDYEASIVMVNDGERIVSFPIGQNIHRDGILDLCIVPAPRMDDAVRARLVEQSEAFMRRCGYTGILAIEYFVKGGELYFNEMAPRPHNSGHYTIEGCTTNQFRELCRYLLGEPLQEPRLVAPTVMKNILGEDLAAAEAVAGRNRSRGGAVAGGGRLCPPLRQERQQAQTQDGAYHLRGDDRREYDARWRGRFVE